MSKFETKTIAKFLLILLAVFALARTSFAANDYTSANFTIKSPVIDTGFSSSSSTNFGLGQSLNQTAIGKSSSASFQLWSGFQYFFKVSANTLTATPGDAQVSLNWTVPATYLGISVSNYEVGVGTVSGSYAFTSVGNVTSYTVSGLTNGTTYYFIVKAESAGGLLLVFSNEANTTPTGSGGSGGGGGTPTTGVVLNGQTFADASLTLVQDSTNLSTTTADASGKFQVTNGSLNPGNYNLILYATDPNGNRTASVSLNEDIAYGVVTTVSNLLLSPTLASDFSVVKQGDKLNLSGYAAPNVSVGITVSSPTKSYNFSATTDAGGKFAYALDTANLAKSDYTAAAFYAFGNTTSPDSLIVNFTVADQSIPPGSTCGRSDLNCDGRVNLIDFSILLYYWDTSNFSANPRVDINRSGKVGVGDFSIMLYDWTG